MTQTLTLEAKTHADAAEIMELLKTDKTLLAALKPMGDRRLRMTGLKIQIDSMAETLEGIFTTARVEGYEITIESTTARVETTIEISERITSMGIVEPLRRLEWLVTNKKDMTIGEAAKIIGGKHE